MRIHFIKDIKGSAMVIFSAALVMIFACVSLAADIGMAMNEKAALSSAVDAAALAGAQEFIGGTETTARDMAKEYLVKNGVSPEQAEITADPEKKTVTVKADKEVDYLFSEVLGITSGTATAQASARAAPISGVNSGVKPFAVEDTQFVLGREYSLKEGGGSGEEGNYHALALGGSGSSNYISNIINGYVGTLRVGDFISTETGNMSGPTETGITHIINDCTHVPQCTYDNYEEDCPRVSTVLVVDSFNVNGRSEVRIVGFASFFIETIEGSGNESIIRGRFIKNTITGYTSENQEDYGLYGIELIK